MYAYIGAILSRHKLPQHATMSLALEYLKQMSLLHRMIQSSWNLSIAKGLSAGGWCKEGQVAFSVSYGMSGYLPPNIPKYPPHRILANNVGDEKDEYLVMAELMRQAMEKPDLPEKMREFMGTLAQVYENIHEAKPTADDFDKLTDWTRILFVAGFEWPKSE